MKTAPDRLRTLQVIALTAIALNVAAQPLPQADSRRHAEVAARGAEVMPFSLAATTHVFEKRPDGGVQRVIAKNRNDKEQVRLIREHLIEIRQRFRRGDYGGPSHIHGEAMPGLAEMRSATTAQLDIAYQEVPGGASLVYRGHSPQVVHAVHRWFDAQLADHGKDAAAGHHHH